MKKASLVKILVVAFVASILCTASACDNGPLQYEGYPISAIGSIRWEEGSSNIYLDITVTNNTNKTIKRIDGGFSEYVIYGNEIEYMKTASGTMSIPDSIQNKQVIKAHSSQTYHIDIGTVSYGEVYKGAHRHWYVHSIVFDNYDTLNLTGLLDFAFEGNRQH